MRPGCCEGRVTGSASLPLRQIAYGQSKDVIDGRVAFQQGTQDELTAAIERLPGRSVTAFLSANQTAPGIACELFFLEASPVRDI